MSRETPTTIKIDVPPRKICCPNPKALEMNYGNTAITARKIAPKSVILVNTVFR